MTIDLAPATGAAVEIMTAVADLADEWSAQRSERQRRRRLDSHDFDRLRAAGYHRACLPIDEGGLWESHARSSRFIFDLLRRLAHGDSSVALVAAMHPLVLSAAGWLGDTTALPPFQEAWDKQRRWAFATVRDGAWWGTIHSEPGSGGDLSTSRAVAEPAPNATNSLHYRLSGQKHFGSGSGIASYMITSTVPVGETEPETFFMDLREVPWDGSTGVKLVAAWDGHGMRATQSHAMEFVDFPVTRLAWPSHSQRLVPASHARGGGFAAVITGIVEVAVETALPFSRHARRFAPLTGPSGPGSSSRPG